MFSSVFRDWSTSNLRSLSSVYYLVYLIIYSLKFITTLGNPFFTHSFPYPSHNPRHRLKFILQPLPRPLFHCKLIVDPLCSSTRCIFDPWPPLRTNRHSCRPYFPDSVFVWIVQVLHLSPGHNDITSLVSLFLHSSPLSLIMYPCASVKITENKNELLPFHDLLTYLTGLDWVRTLSYRDNKTLIYPHPPPRDTS